MSVRPSEVARRARSEPRERAEEASRPVVGSSATSTAGSVSSATARERRRRSPPEAPPARVALQRDSPRSDATAAARADRDDCGHEGGRRSEAEKDSVSATVSAGKEGEKRV